MTQQRYGIYLEKTLLYVYLTFYNISACLMFSWIQQASANLLNLFVKALVWCFKICWPSEAVVKYCLTTESTFNSLFFSILDIWILMFGTEVATRLQFVHDWATRCCHGSSEIPLFCHLSIYVILFLLPNTSPLPLRLLDPVMARYKQTAFCNDLEARA